MFASDFAAAKVETDPFPHAVVDGLFDAATFAALAASYPECPPGSGPTGRTIHRGDALFDAVMAGSPAWRELFAHTDGQGFVDRLAAMFHDEVLSSCAVPSERLRHVDHNESRADKERLQTLDPAHPPEAVFTRFDFMQGMNAYAREPHLDHRRRLATMLIYFDAPGPDTFQGGDLVLHDARGSPVKRIAPAANRAVLFPCSERSWHSVDAVTKCRRPRRFVQVAVSSCHAIWPDAKLPARSPLAWGRRLVKALGGAA